MPGLRVLDDAIELVVLCRPLWEKVARHHAELSKQLRRSSVSVPLNIAEGDGRWDGNGRQRLTTAMHEARETHVNLRTGVAAGFLREEEAREARALSDKIAATLYKLVGTRGA